MDMPTSNSSMLNFQDARWQNFTAGYRVPVDLRPLLRDLETTSSPEVAWDDLWDELHHQGDVGPGSSVAVPHLVRIHRLRGNVDWNTYALVSTIELARGRGDNPDVPEWAVVDYQTAIRDLANLGLAELPQANDSITTRPILALLALTFGARKHARLLAEYGEEELDELTGSTNAAAVARAITFA